MSHEAFHHVLFPGSVTVLGRVLPPLSLWSLSVLQALRSPFVAECGEFTLADLQLAVRCACAPVLSPPDLRPRFRDRLLWRLKHRSLSYLEAEAAAFTAWLQSHQRLPALWQSETADPRFLSAPLVLSQVAALMALGMSHVEAWSCSPGYARWLILANDERNSEHIRFADDDEMEDAAFDEFEQRSEADIIAQARLDLDEETFNRWIQARNERSADTPVR